MLKSILFAVLVSISISAPAQEITTANQERIPVIKTEIAQAMAPTGYRIVVLEEATGNVEIYFDDIAPAINNDMVRTSIKQTTKLFGRIWFITKLQFDRKRYSVCIQAPGKDYVFYPRIRS